MNTTRTYLCPDCGGWGVIQLNDGSPYGYGPDPQDDHEVDCIECDSSGVVVRTYRDGAILDLVPWDGLSGKVLEGVRAAKRTSDPLLDMGRLRRERHHPLGGSFYYKSYRKKAMARGLDSRFQLFDARAQRIAAMAKSREAEARMLAMAQQCVEASDAAVAAFRKAAA